MAERDGAPRGTDGPTPDGLVDNVQGETLDKDGQVKQRRPLPWDVREISRAIDKLPLRRQEIGRAGLLP